MTEAPRFGEHPTEHADAAGDEMSPPFEYEVLVGHRRTDGSRKSQAELQTEYVRLTDRLVHSITEGVSVTNPGTGETEQKPVDYVIWLDKSARPVAWLTKDLWPELAQSTDGSVPKMPEFKFLNIDREQWNSVVDPNNTGAIDVDNVNEQIVRSLRSIFLAKPEDRTDLTDPTIDTAPTIFDDKTIMVVDEVKSSGATLAYTLDFLRRAFPESNFTGEYWMSSTVTTSRGTGNADVPVWYREDTTLGRGVADRDVMVSSKSRNRAQRLGAWFLSTRHRGADPASDRLRNELHHLAEDVRNHNVFVVPSPTRDEADFDEHALRLNGMKDMTEYINAAKRRQNEVAAAQTAPRRR